MSKKDQTTIKVIKKLVYLGTLALVLPTITLGVTWEAVKAERADQQDAGSAALVVRDSIGILPVTSGAPPTNASELTLGATAASSPPPPPPTPEQKRWVLLPQTAKPPYSRDVFCLEEYLERMEKSQYELGTARVRCLEVVGQSPKRKRALEGTCQKDTSWKYAWQGNPLLGADRMCALANGIKLVVIGDSLSMQLLASWMARLRSAGRNACPADVNSTLAPGIAVMLIQMRPWTAATKLTSSDLRGEKCAAEFCASQFSEEPLSADHMLKVLILSKNTTGAPATSYRYSSRGGGSHESRKIRVVYNAYAHLHLNMIASLSECYNKTGISDIQSKALATRDALIWWRGEVAAAASIFQEVRNRAKLEVPPIDVRTFYRTSPGPADQLHAMDGASSPLSSAAASLEYYFTTPPEKTKYSHHVYQAMNDVSVSVFSAFGHGIIDTEVMMGMRIDAHPASVKGDKQKAGQSDALHFCMPGVPDYALDLVLRSLQSDDVG